MLLNRIIRLEILQLNNHSVWLLYDTYMYNCFYHIISCSLCTYDAANADQFIIIIVAISVQ